MWDDDWVNFLSDPAKNGKYTYKDYKTWPDNERWELINGIAYCMSPAPKREHQKVSFEISRQIGNFLADKPCEAYTAPLDVKLSALPGADYPVFCYFEYDLEDVHHTAVSTAIIKIIEPENLFRRYRWLWMGVAAVLIIAFLGLAIKNRRKPSG